MPTDPLQSQLATLLAIAWLAPLVGFVIELFGGYWSRRTDKLPAVLACGCIGLGFVCSAAALYQWGEATDWAALKGASHAEEHAGGSELSGQTSEVRGQTPDAHPSSLIPHPSSPTTFTGTFYTLAHFGDLRVTINYYIDSLTLVMFVMVTLVATCIHVFAVGYMADELTDDHADHEVHLSDGSHLHRPGRFHLFFSYMSLFSFSMLGLVLAGNIFMVFVFWELVGICSYLLIGFYVERKSACNAANKAFIMNRVGDFGFLIGLMIIWTYFGTFQFRTPESHAAAQPGLFQMLRDSEGHLHLDEMTNTVQLHGPGERSIPYWLLVAAGLGIFAGCVGKSAQFPLQTWLPDAMEGPTPVSALVHSATMVAAGVYLAGRFFPVFTPEVLLVIAYVGCITLFLAATIAVVATDIKRVLAYSTISQLGYMMLGIGVFGWGAGLFHLITHAFFKSLMFLCSGSVIIACHHEQEMPRMGGLMRKMPITAATMLVGVLAICGLSIPGTPIALSGFYSKDAIIATSMAYMQLNPAHVLLFLIPLITAGITAFYMFRLWFMTFTGEPRDQEMYHHVHESPAVMTWPLIVLAVFAAGCASFGGFGEESWLYRLLSFSTPAGVAAGAAAAGHAVSLGLPGHAAVAGVHASAGAYALLFAFSGTLAAYLLYGTRLLDPAEIARQFSGVYHFLVEKWQFDNMYDFMFVRPVHVVASWCAFIDGRYIDGFLHWISRFTVDVSRWDRRFDESIIDGLVNLTADVIFGIGRSFRHVQTGLLRQYVMFIALGVVGLFMLLFLFFPK